MTDGMRIFTIQSSDLAACPTHVLLPGHYRKDGTCLHDLREKEPVVFKAGFLDDGVREMYDGQKAVILTAIESTRLDGPDYVIEFESGNRLEAFANEVSPDDNG
jgi:hypothetical protein